MEKEIRLWKENGGMIPKSVLTGVIRDTVKTQSDEKIIEFADILYSGFARWGDHEIRLSEHSIRMDQQHADITRAIDAMNAGFAASEKRFEAMDKRFDDLIHNMDKRFEAVDKRFDDLIHHMDKRFSTLAWAIGVAFIVINITMVVLKLF